MKSTSQQSKRIMRYLLGELGADEQSELEELYFADPSFFHEVTSARDELIDAYLRDELTDDERERFEHHFMSSSHRRERVEFAKALIGIIEKTDEPSTASIVTESPSTPRRKSLLTLLTEYRRPVLAAVLTVIVIAGVWLAIKTLLKNPVERNQVQQVTPTPPEQTGSEQIVESNTAPPEKTPLPDATDTPTKRSPALKPEPRVIAFTLTPGLLRGDETKVLIVPHGANRIRFKLEVEEANFQNYTATLRTPEGIEIWRRQLNPRPPQDINLTLPATLLKSGDYILSLSGTTAEHEVANAGKYYFRVEAK